MALRKILQLENGAEASYWRVAGDIRMNRDEPPSISRVQGEPEPQPGAITFSLLGYASRGVRDDSNQSLVPRTLTVRGAEFRKLFPPGCNIEARCYAAAKKLDPFFADAEDA